MSSSSDNRGLARAAPFAIFVVLASITFLVWQQQVGHQRSLIRRHTTDICYQAARRLQILVESQLRLVAIFGQRWATHGREDFSRQRFDEFASLLVKDLPGCHAARLIHSHDAPDWVAPAGTPSAWLDSARSQKDLLRAAAKRQRIVLSAPVRTRTGHTAFFAAMPLLGKSRSMGHLVVEFRADELLGTGFHDRIRSEFLLWVDDDATPLYWFDNTRSPTEISPTVSVTKTFSIENRTWRMTVRPRYSQGGMPEWNASLAIPLLGLVLSVGISLLVHLLGRRVRLYQVAHDQAVTEMAARAQAQEDLHRSQRRYRSVFDSATDGMLVLDDDEIVEANAAAAAMHGYEREELPKHRVTELIAPAQQHLFAEFQRQIHHYGSARLNSVDQRKDGSTFDVEVRGTLFDYAGQSRMLAILTDVSDRKQALRRHALLSQKVLMAQEDERARVSRDLHDELGQILTALHLELSWLNKKALAKKDPTADGFGNAIAMVEKAAAELRRICGGLRPPLLDDLGLEPAVRLLIGESEEHTSTKHDLEVQLAEANDSITPEIALCTYRILQEALNNARRHAKATEVSISLIVADNELLLSVYDDGQGFDVESIGTVEGYGIAGMRERASLVNGHIEIRSEPAQGTRVALRVPLGVGQEKRT